MTLLVEKFVCRVHGYNHCQIKISMLIRSQCEKKSTLNGSGDGHKGNATKVIMPLTYTICTFGEIKKRLMVLNNRHQR